MITIIGISLLTVCAITVGAAILIPLFLLGIAVGIIKFLAPALLVLTLGLGIGFGIGNMAKEKAPVQAPVEIYIEAAQELAHQMIAIPVKIQK